MQNQTGFSGKIWAETHKSETLESIKKALLESFEVPVESIDTVFLDPQIKDLHDPYLMSGVDRAVERIKQAIENQERIMVYGDFDTDGVTSTIILVKALMDLGAPVSYRIPDRTRHSHGLKTELIDEIASKGVKLLVTCDCGINDQAEIEYATSKGMEVIVTDHHDPDPGRYPRSATAVLNPLISECTYPDTNLSGAGIALKLVQALFENGQDDYLNPYLEMAAIGIIADCVPLRGESRIIAKLGIESLRDTSWEGLRTFFIEQEIDPESIDEETIGFALAPRINAASRLGDVKMAVQLFIGDIDQIDQRWEYLHRLNEKRKTLTQSTLEEALTQVDLTKSCQVVFAPDWLQGILGLVASRICEKTNQPTIALRAVDKNYVSASCRAPEGFNMIQALHQCGDLFTHFGGHEGAAGFMAPRANLEQIKLSLDDHFKALEVPKPPLKPVASLNIEVLSIELMDFINRLGPFGVGHPRPIFSLESAQILAVQPLGQSGNHFKITATKDDEIVELVAFFKGDWTGDIISGETYDLAFSLGDNYFQGERRVQLKLEDIRISRPTS